MPLLRQAAQFMPLSIGVACGLHWIIQGGIIEHRPGVPQAVVRTLGPLLARYALPDQRVTTCALIVVTARAMTLIQVRTRLRRRAVTILPGAPLPMAMDSVISSRAVPQSEGVA